MTYQQPPMPPPGQRPVDPTGVFAPVPPPRGGMGMPPGPPPVMFPPPMYYPPPPPPQRTGMGFARAIFVTLATSIFGLSLALNVYLLMLTGIAGGSDGVTMRTKTIVEGDQTQKIAVVPVDGVIMSKQAERFDKILKSLEKDSSIKALVLELNTPGGSVTASDAMYHRVERFKADTGKKVVVCMTEVAASGGYYIAVAGDHIMAGPTTITGSIGVILPKYDLSEFGDKYGIHDDSIHSTGADYKTVGSMFRKDTPDERAYLVNLIDQAFTRFKSVISAGRGTKIKGDLNKIANGKVYTSKEALDFGLIDSATAYPEDAYKQAATLAGVTTTKYSVVKYEPQESLLEMLSAKSPLGGGNARTTIVNGLHVNVDQDLLRELISPRLMYLWRGE